MEPVTTTVTPAPAAKTTVTAEPTKIAGSVITANTTKNADKTAQDILSSLLYYLYYYFVSLLVVCVCLTLIKGSSFVVAFVLDSTLELVSTLLDVLSDGGKNVLIPFL